MNWSDNRLIEARNDDVRLRVQLLRLALIATTIPHEPAIKSKQEELFIETVELMLTGAFDQGIYAGRVYRPQPNVEGTNG